MTIELVSFADLKTLLNLEEFTINDYPELELIRDNVAYAIESYLSRNLEIGTYTEKQYQIQSSKMIALKALPITSITSVTVTDAGVSTVLDADLYEITEYGLRLDDSVLTEKISLSVVYVGGYLAADIPHAIARAALLQTAFEFQSKDNIGAESVSNSGGSVQKPALGLLEEVKRLLDKYKHPLVWS